MTEALRKPTYRVPYSAICEDLQNASPPSAKLDSDEVFRFRASGLELGLTGSRILGLGSQKLQLLPNPRLPRRPGVLIELGMQGQRINTAPTVYF